MRYITNLYTTETWRPVTYYLQAQKFTRFSRADNKNAISKIKKRSSFAEIRYNIVIFSDIDTLVCTISPSDSDEIPPYRCLFRFNNQIDKHITS